MSNPTAEWDHRKCHREWLIEILAGKAGAMRDVA
jgi:hypothetical protein